MILWSKYPVVSTRSRNMKFDSDARQIPETGMGILPIRSCLCGAAVTENRVRCRPFSPFTPTIYATRGYAVRTTIRQSASYLSATIISNPVHSPGV